MANISVQCCGLVLLLIAVIFYYTSPRLKVRTQNIFGYLLWLSIATLALDIVSVLAIMHSGTLPDILVNLSAKIYLFVLICMSFIGFLYLAADIYPDSESYHRTAVISGSVFAVLECLILALPIDFVCEEQAIYTYGPSPTVAYISFGLFFITMLAHLIYGRKKLIGRRRFAVGIWLLIWVISAVIQFLFKNLLIVSFAGALGVTIIFVMIENPEIFLARGNNFFHTISMEKYVNETYERDGKFFLICTIFDSDSSYVDFFKNFKSAKIFVGSADIYLIFDSREQYALALNQISRELTDQMIYVVDDSRIFHSFQELVYHIKSAKKYYNQYNRSNVCLLDLKIWQETTRKKRMNDLLKEALEEDRIEIYFQPIYSFEQKSFSSAEALVRIFDRSGNVIPPSDFIPIAEAEGQIIPLGRVVFKKVCEFISRHDLHSLGIQYIETNLSIIQYEDKALVKDILKTIKPYQIPAGLIRFEVTESASVHGKEQLLENMSILRKAGFQFVLDDFGTGNSNLDYMSTMPIGIVKFDRTMTNRYFQSEKSRCIMEASIRMIHDLGMEIVIEGIETKDEFEAMERLNVEFIQGFYFSKPIPEDEFIAFAQKNRM